MTNTTQQISGTEPGYIPLGAKLQSARESMRLDRKDAAAQLRLNESIIDMIENNSFPDTMPPIFIRGYIRSYGKLLQLPEEEVQAGLVPIKPIVSVQDAQPALPIIQTETLGNRRYLVHGITAAIALTLLWLVAAWWHGHSSSSSTITTAVALPEEHHASTVPAGISAAATQAAANVKPDAPLAAEAFPAKQAVTAMNSAGVAFNPAAVTPATSVGAVNNTVMASNASVAKEEETEE